MNFSRRFFLALCILVVGALDGCTGDYSKFYTPISGYVPGPREEVSSSEPIVERSPVVPSPSIYGRRGYQPIGYSFFNSGHSESEADAVAQGKKVGANLIVLVAPQYAGSSTTQLPITTPTTETSVTNASATAVGPRGAATVYGNSTTTTYGSQTSYIPITIQRHSYGAVFFVKRRYALGANWRDLNDKERASLQSNSGVYVTSVVNGTPAFAGNILAGDVILNIAGHPASNSQTASMLTNANRGQQVTIVIARNGKTLTKQVRLLP